MSSARPLRGRTKIDLIRECALDARSERELAEQFGVTHQAIGAFKAANAARIRTARLDIENEFAALWVADKKARLAEYENDVEEINDALAVAAPENRPRLYAAKHRALRNAAEELGQLQPKTVSVGTTVRYEIVGVDLDQLR